MTVDISGLKELQSGLREMSGRRLNAAIATALTRSAREIAKGWQGELQAKLDRPTPFTLKSVKVDQATAAKLQAVVSIQQPGGKPAAISPGEYLQTQERGGSRRQRKFEAALQAQGSMPRGMFVVPGKYAQLDGFGNISRGQIVQVLSQLGSAFSPGYQRVISKSAAKRQASAIKRGVRYVAVLEPRGRLKPGVYYAFGGDLLPVFFYTRGTRYNKRVDLMGKARRDVPDIVTREIQKALSEQFARLAAKRSGGAL